MPEVAAIEFALEALHMEFVHEESHFDFQASPEMLVTTGGPAPQVTAASGLSLSYPAATTLSALRAARAAPDGIRYASSTDPPSDVGVLGITTSSATTGQDIAVQTSGEITDLSWAWTPNKSIFAGPDGVLTQAPPTVGNQIVMGIAIAPTRIFVRVETLIILEV
jgi:hypothetical protein